MIVLAALNVSDRREYKSDNRPRHQVLWRIWLILSVVVVNSSLLTVELGSVALSVLQPHPADAELGRATKALPIA